MSQTAPEPARYESFQAFWPYYVAEHRNPTCRTLHYIGTTLAILNVGALLVTLSPWFLLSGMVGAYGFAWTGHFFVEKNRPATFKYPFWSLAADFKMYGLALRGQMSDEVAKVCGAPLTEQEA